MLQIKNAEDFGIGFNCMTTIVEKRIADVKSDNHIVCVLI